MNTPREGIKQLARLDTMEVVETAEMIDADKQAELPLADPNGEAATVRTVVDSDPASGVVNVPADKDDEDNG